MGRHSARLYSAANIQSAYSLCSSARHHDRQRCPLSSAASRLAGDRPVPHIVTELPGPKARAHVAFDEDLDLAEPAPRLPDRAGPRRGPDGRGHRRQPLPRLRRRHRRQLDRPRAPAGRRRDQGAGRRAHPLLGVRLLPADLRRGLPAPRRDRADRPARRGRTSATPARRSSRPRSSSPATPPSARTSSRSSARSTAGPTARSR